MRQPLLALILGLWLSVGQPVPQVEARQGESTQGPHYGEAISLLETWIQSIVDYDRLPGLSLAVVHDQTIVFTKGFGLSDRNRRVTATAGTVYSICSISKLLTAIAVMQLRDAGRLSLDDPVTKYLPWFKPKFRTPDDQPPTLADLLRHSSGLPCEPDRTVWDNPADVFPSRDELITRAADLKMSYSPNTKFNYSNLGYALLGQVVAKCAGMEYADYIHQNILEPLGLDATTSYDPTGRAGIEIARGYGPHPRRGQRIDIVNHDHRSMTSALGFYSTVEDLAKFAMWQFRVFDGKDNSVLSRETLQEMSAVQWPNPTWGLGFTIWNMGDLEFVGHQGGCPGYKSLLIICPEEKVAVVVMVNATDAPDFTLAFRTFEIMAPVLKSPHRDETGQNGWEEYIGFYTSADTWSDAEVLSWSDGLAVMWVPGGNPNPLGSLARLTRIDGEVFRQLEADGELGKYYVFHRDQDGNVVSFKFNNNVLVKTAR